MGDYFKKKIYDKFISYLILMGCFNWMSDERFIKFQWKYLVSYPLSINHPQSFNEKIQWLKLYNRDVRYTNLVDKYLVKNIVASLIGNQYIIPTLGIWDTFDDIDIDGLPDKFVLKCTHDSGGVFLVDEKQATNFKYIRKKMNRSLKRNYYNLTREWAYKDVVPRIIAEELIEDASGEELKDYKVFCFEGKPHIIQVDINRRTNHCRNIYDTEWKRIDLEILYPQAPDEIIPRPNCLEELLDLASKISKDLIFSRIDFYIVNDKIYFGEITLYHGGGYEPITPRQYDYELGKLINITRCDIK